MFSRVAAMRTTNAASASCETACGFADARTPTDRLSMFAWTASMNSESSSMSAFSHSSPPPTYSMAQLRMLVVASRHASMTLMRALSLL